jgi:hypothetical protein
MFVTITNYQIEKGFEIATAYSLNWRSRFIIEWFIVDHVCFRWFSFRRLMLCVIVIMGRAIVCRNAINIID